MNSLKIFVQSFARKFSTCGFNKTKEFGLYSISDEVTDALCVGKGVVALESTVLTHGLPFPKNLEVAKNLEKIVRSEGVVPATIALIDGKICVGLTNDQLTRITHPNSNAIKCSTRDVASCLVDRKIGGTTVSASIWIASQLGLKFFATGGIGGVHRGAEYTFDVSADLRTLGRTPIIAVCAGAKSILDIPKTLEYLETEGVNIVVYGEDNRFPGFFFPKTKHEAPYFTNSLKDIAEITRFHFHLEYQSALIIAAQLNSESSDQNEAIEKGIELSLSKAKDENVNGKNLTPFLLSEINRITGSASMQINIKLLENNVKIASKLAYLHATSGYTSSITSGYSLKKQETSKNSNNQVVCVGGSLVDFQVFCKENAQSPSAALSDGYLRAKISQKPGGVARNHCDALTRLGINASLISVFSDDQLAEFLIHHSKHCNLEHSHKVKGIDTQSSLGILDSFGHILGGFISDSKAIESLTPDIIHSKANILSSADFVIVDANITEETLHAVLERSDGKKIWFEPTNQLKVHKLLKPKNIMERINILSPNFYELKSICQHLKIDDKFHGIDKLLLACKMQDPEICRNIAFPECLFSDNLDFLIVTMDKFGVALIKRGGSSESSNTLSGHQVLLVPPPISTPGQIVSTSGAGDW